MTRTERATSPRALVKDRSEPRNAMGREIAKGGAGPHNWGSLLNERELEDGAFEDEEHDLAEAGVPINRKAEPSGTGRKSSVSVSPEDREAALNVRKNALKNGAIDLAAIARSSSAVSHSPEDTVEISRDTDTAKQP